MDSPAEERGGRSQAGGGADKPASVALRRSVRRIWPRLSNPLRTFASSAPSGGTRPTTRPPSESSASTGAASSKTASTVSERDSASWNVLRTPADAFGRCAAILNAAARPEDTSRNVCAASRTSSASVINASRAGLVVGTVRKAGPFPCAAAPPRRPGRVAAARCQARRDSLIQTWFGAARRETASAMKMNF
jgi:hypothetical protein